MDAVTMVYTWDVTEPVIGEVDPQIVEVEFTTDTVNIDPTLTIFYEPQPLETDEDNG